MPDTPDTPPSTPDAANAPAAAPDAANAPDTAPAPGPAAAPAAPAPGRYPLYSWRGPPVPPAPPAILRVLLARGWAAASAAPGSPAASAGPFDLSALRDFLSPSLSRLCDPFSLPGIRETAGLILSAAARKAPIAVFGDFDADGISATAILARALAALPSRPRVLPFLPDRRTEGYGLTRAAVDRCLASGPRPGLLVTVDCGMGSAEEIARIRGLGIPVAVTDHHDPAGGVPPADAVVNPLLPGAPAALRHLCGAGVAFKLAHALVQAANGGRRPADGRVAGPLLAIAAVATVADVVPLLGENRIIVAEAAARWNRIAPPGLKALFERCAKKSAPPDAEDFAFLLAPRINAAGRMASASLAYDLLMTADPDAARSCAARLEGLNACRKATEQRIFREACELAGPAAADAGGGEGPGEGSGEGAVVVAKQAAYDGCGWHPGVIGIVASRLSERARRPAAVIALDGPDPAAAAGRGSIRAGEGYDVTAALRAAAETLAFYGGHARAAGFTLKPGALPAFRRLFSEACAAQRGRGAAAGPPPLPVDAWVAPEELTPALCDAQRRLGPFGCGNPKIRWGLRGAALEKVEPLGADRSHLSLRLAAAGRPLPRAVWFREGANIAALRRLKNVDIVFELTRNEYACQTSLELRIIDIAPGKER